ncbi:unnamed protein product [Ambrosiozyma monospora]|uniref:Unnamed protein product n=1 Tax=Ambrosiozyma monospora TaxID=43982 RepID=A0ACB5T5K9_AMBMO|nr:unnamed protein product [Ambrosiozyma monospora]
MPSWFFGGRALSDVRNQPSFRVQQSLLQNHTTYHNQNHTQLTRMSSRGGFKGSTSARFVKNKTDNSNNSNSQQQQNYNVFSKEAKQQQQRDAYNNSTRNKLDQVKEIDTIDSVFGFDRFESGPKRTGWLVNMHPTTLPSADVIAGVSGWCRD